MRGEGGGNAREARERRLRWTCEAERKGEWETTGERAAAHKLEEEKLSGKGGEGMEK